MEPTPSGSATTSMPVTPARLQSSVNTASIASHVTTDDHWRAEVLWAMKVVSSHYSYVSCMETDRLFQLMFPESAIAKSSSCGEKKSAYIICYGLAPYFSQQLKDQVRLLDSFVSLMRASTTSLKTNRWTYTSGSLMMVEKQCIPDTSPVPYLAMQQLQTWLMCLLRSVVQ